MANNFDKKYDVKTLQESIEKAKENSGDFPEVPAGKYEVKIEKIELGETKNTGMPMAKVQFRIVDGDFKKACLFYNQVLVGLDKETKQLTAFGIHNFNKFLKALKVFDESEITFKDFNDYEQLLLDIAEEAENWTFDIELSFKNEYPNYRVLNYYPPKR